MTNNQSPDTQKMDRGHDSIVFFGGGGVTERDPDFRM
jgi:hypothetical protein